MTLGKVKELGRELKEQGSYGKDSFLYRFNGATWTREIDISCVEMPVARTEGGWDMVGGGKTE